MILCVGAAGSGKSTLLKVLQQHGQNCSESTDPEGAPPPLPPTILDEMPIPIPTVGTNIVTLTRCKKYRKIFLSIDELINHLISGIRAEKLVLPKHAW